jgi:hypothetical protein
MFVFVDNICNQSADHILLTGPGPESQLFLFSPMFVSRLPTEELERIAGEISGHEAAEGSASQRDWKPGRGEEEFALKNRSESMRHAPKVSTHSCLVFYWMLLLI